jgi:alkanesulfonate monooxygenase SsuD/methylene tetrahydromethanopterin reductase-like flavin-dependent oxidoreductase (luciferase family)
MKFGFFGGASAAATGTVNDSMASLGHFADYICAAEAVGFHGLFLVEHHFMGTGQISSSLSLLAYLAAKTSKIRLGTGVVVLPWHNPVLVAEQLATVDQLSNGRLDFGMGKGYRPNEFACFRISPEEAARRYEETQAFLRRAWSSTERFDHRGEFWSFDNVVIDPPTVQKPHPPLWVGATSRESIERAGRDGMNLLLDQLTTAEVIGQRINWYRAAVEARGGTFDPMSVGVTRAMRLVDNEADWREAHQQRAALLKVLKQAAGPRPAGPAPVAPAAQGPNPQQLKTFADSSLTVDEAALIGYPHEVLEKLRVLKSHGVDYVLLADGSCSHETLQIFAKELMPKFKESSSPQAPPRAAVAGSLR